MSSQRLIDALRPLVDIANAYDSNDLDDEARKFWGRDLEKQNDRDPEHIELYQGRGGRQLLTLADCLRAREAVLEDMAETAREIARLAEEANALDEKREL